MAVLFCLCAKKPLMMNGSLWLFPRQDLVEEIDNLSLPPYPVVAHVLSPVVYPRRNVLLSEHGIQLSCSSQQVVLPSALSHTADYLALPVELVVVVVRRKVA